MRKVLFFMFLWIVCLFMTADASDFLFSPPTTFADGSAIPESWESSLAYKFYCGYASHTYHVEVYAGHLDPNAQNDCVYPIGNVVPSDGIWYCAAATYFTFDTANESAKSNEVFFAVKGGVIPGVAPSPVDLRFKK